jgi:hypothetical protein
MQVSGDIQNANYSVISIFLNLSEFGKYEIELLIFILPNRNSKMKNL